MKPALLRGEGCARVPPKWCRAPMDPMRDRMCAITPSGSSSRGNTSCDWTWRKQRDGNRRPSCVASRHTLPMAEVGGGWPVAMDASTSADSAAMADSQEAARPPSCAAWPSVAQGCPPPTDFTQLPPHEHLLLRMLSPTLRPLLSCQALEREDRASSTG